MRGYAVFFLTGRFSCCCNQFNKKAEDYNFFPTGDSEVLHSPFSATPLDRIKYCSTIHFLQPF